MKITVHETTNGKIPGCYAGKTFDVVQTVKVGDPAPSTREGVAKWDRWEGKLKNGKRVSFTRYDNFPGKLFVDREGCLAGTWINAFEFSA